MSEEITYAAAGVDTAEGARAVDAIKETVHSTYRPEVVGDIGGFGGLFSIAAAKGMEDRCSCRAPMAWAPSSRWPSLSASMARWASTLSPCA